MGRRARARQRAGTQEAHELRRARERLREDSDAAEVKAFATGRAEVRVHGMPAEVDRRMRGAALVSPSGEVVPLIGFDPALGVDAQPIPGSVTAGIFTNAHGFTLRRCGCGRECAPWHDLCIFCEVRAASKAAA